MTQNTSFLSEIAELLHDKYKETLTDLCIVMPTNRGIIHLKKELVKKVGKTFLSPDFFSIEQFMQHVSGLSAISREELILKLYAVHKEINTSESKEFYDFAATAQIILQDFNDIDLSLANPKDVFSDLSNIKTLSFFGKTERELSTYQKSYLLFFKQLYNYYMQLNQVLLNEKQAYQGMIYRIAYEKKEEICTRFPYKKYIFIGFNALQNAEFEIVKYLIENKNAEFYADADEWYLNDEQQEAGKFLRQFKRDLNIDTWQFTGKQMETIPKKIQILGFPQKNLQAVYINQILEDLPISETDKTAIVLSDESLLLPVLYSMDATKANITMGLPIRNTQIYKLLYQYFVAIENKQRFKNSERVYYKDLYAFFNSSYIQNILLLESINAKEFLALILEKGKLFYSKDELKQLCENLPLVITDFLITLFDPNVDAKIVVEHITDLLNLINTSNVSETDKEIIKLLSANMFDLLSVFKQIENDNIKSFRVLFDYFVSSLTLSFKSDTFNRLQLMGMLETRTLDFDNVIMLSVNEGILPMGKQGQSFIPYDVKRFYNIPTYTNGEAIFSYHFYRLLQRARKIYLLYDLDNQNGNAEKSRFISQIQSEWSQWEHVSIEESILSYPKALYSPKEIITIQKTTEITQKIDGISSFSPSMLNRYLNCKLQFYFNDVLGLREQESMSEDIQANVIGSVIHKILEKILKNQQGGKIVYTDESIQEIVMETICDKSVTSMNLIKDDFMYEKNHLVYNIIVKYIKDYLAFLKDQLEKNENFKIIDFEKRYNKELSLDDSEFPKKVRLKGIVDRLDMIDGVVSVLDYKTGNVTGKDISISKIEDLFTGEHPIAFQLMFYAYMHYLETAQSPLKAQIVSFRNIQLSLFYAVNKDAFLTPLIFDEFALHLKELINQLFDHTTSFTQTTDSKRCTWCDYKTLCMRE